MNEDSPAREGDPDPEFPRREMQTEDVKRILESFGYSVEDSNYPEIRAEAEARL